MDIIWASGAQDLGSIPSEATKKRAAILAALFLMPTTPITVGFRISTFLFTCIEVFEIIGEAQHEELLKYIALYIFIVHLCYISNYGLILIEYIKNFYS